MSNQRSRVLWITWWRKEFGEKTTEAWLEYLYPNMDVSDRMCYASAFNTDKCYKPFLEYLAMVLRDAPLNALEEFADPDRTIDRDGIPIQFMLELVQVEIAERILLGIKEIE